VVNILTTAETFRFDSLLIYSYINNNQTPRNKINFSKSTCLLIPSAIFNLSRSSGFDNASIFIYSCWSSQRFFFKGKLYFPLEISRYLLILHSPHIKQNVLNPSLILTINNSNYLNIFFGARYIFFCFKTFCSWCGY